MYKLLFDSDALIKISKAEFLDVVAENFDVYITEEVYDETVKEGKKWFRFLCGPWDRGISPWSHSPPDRP